MLYLHCQKARISSRFLTMLLVAVGLLVSTVSQAQRELHLYDHDYKPYYFGITLGGNSARFHTNMHSRFLENDSISIAEPNNSFGFSLGLSATARISDRFQVRVNPQLLFSERSIFYQLKYPEAGGVTQQTKTVESVIVTFPVHVKLQSDRIGNFRVYMLGGVKGDIDLASNARAKKSEDLIKIKKFDYGVEAGIGFNFFFPSFILSPELKISNGIPNLHSRDVNLKYSSVFDKIQSRMIMFSLHIEG